MKAAVCYKFDAPLIIEEVEIDPPQYGEVKIRLAATAICHSDIHHLKGDWGGTVPFIAGHEAAGVVETIGSGVSLTKAGDHVVVSLLRSCGRCFYCMKGTPHLCEADYALDRESRLRTKQGEAIRRGVKTAAFAEYVIVDQSQVVQIPETMPLDRACLLACGVITGLGAVVNTAKIEAGSSVLVIGTGGVGLNAVQGAVLAGAFPVIALDLLDNKLEAARIFGATHTINARQQKNPEALVKELTAGRGVDYIFVTVGSSSAARQGFKMLRRGGTLVMVGMPPTASKLTMVTDDFVSAEHKFLSSVMGGTRLSIDVPRLVDMYQYGRLKLDELITARYSLQQINEAIAAVERGEALRNIIVF